MLIALRPIACPLTQPIRREDRTPALAERRASGAAPAHECASRRTRGVKKKCARAKGVRRVASPRQDLPLRADRAPSRALSLHPGAHTRTDEGDARAWLVLGELEGNEALMEHSWEVSGGKFAGAKRALARRAAAREDHEAALAHWRAAASQRLAMRSSSHAAASRPCSGAVSGATTTDGGKQEHVGTERV